tara:strand:+ start:34152 stop:34445 length:294 start_codon:yes stop_codon:yes gene_type:complete
MSTGKDESVFVGDKPFMNYVNVVTLQFNIKKAKEIVVKARGKYVSKAVDICEVSKRMLDGLVEYNGVIVGSESFKNKEGRDIRVSIIELSLRSVMNG